MKNELFYVVITDLTTREKYKYDNAKFYAVLKIENLELKANTSKEEGRMPLTHATYFLIPNRDGEFYWIYCGHCSYRN